MAELIEKDKTPQKAQCCPAVGSQIAKICLPVSTHPYAVTGPISIHCCGDPVIKQSCDHCFGKVNGACDFTISQKIRVDVPVEFGAMVNVGETYVSCGHFGDENLDLEEDCDCKSLE
ncbi:MAG: hypothetical protein Q8865_10540 [Bacillota bacterium]|nr:hypothetical protein [Bacillota bacterium]